MAWLDPAIAASIPHYGVPKHELTYGERNERFAAVRQLTADQQTAYRATVARDHGRVGGTLQHAARKAARRAAGLPETRREESGRASRHLPADVEDVWTAFAERQGLTSGRTRQQVRDIARQLADAAVREEQSRAGTSRTYSDDGLLAEHLRERVDYWTARAARERADAVRSDRRAAEAADGLAAAMQRLGRVGRS